MLRYETLSASAGLKKWVSAAVAADYGDSQALWLPPGLTAIGKWGIAVGAASLTNRSGAAAHVGLGARYPITAWAAGTVTSAGVLTDATAAAQNATTGDFTLHDRTDSGSGFLIGAGAPFNILSLIQSAAGDQTTPVKIVEYWDGSGWTNILASLLISDTLIGGGTGEKVLCWPLPSDWALGGSGTGVSQTLYNLRVRHTTAAAGTANPVASQLFLGFARMLVPSLGHNAQAALIRESEYLFPRVAEALFPVFSTADRGNLVEVSVRGY